MWVDEKTKEKARQVNLIQFLQEVHPDLIFQRESGEYAFTKHKCITFFKGRDGVYRYCDHEKRNKGEWDYSGDGIAFLSNYVGGYNFTSAVSALLNFDKNQSNHT